MEQFLTTLGLSGVLATAGVIGTWFVTQERLRQHEERLKIIENNGSERSRALEIKLNMLSQRMDENDRSTKNLEITIGRIEEKMNFAIEQIQDIKERITRLEKEI